MPLERSCLSKKLFPKTLLVIKVHIAIGIIDALAYWYEPVNSRTSIIAVLGTYNELETATMPETANTMVIFKSKIKIINNCT